MIGKVENVRGQLTRTKRRECCFVLLLRLHCVSACYVAHVRRTRSVRAGAVMGFEANGVKCFDPADSDKFGR